ncbi:MAG TPA: hypothetical protein VIP46_10500, partial [Pyrinomonadaceae bacterium]
MQEKFLVLGGGGMIGRQVVHEIAGRLRPQWILVASRYQKEVRQALKNFRREFPHVHFLGSWGDVFLRAEWNSQEHRMQRPRSEVLKEPGRRAAIYEDIFGDFGRAYEGSQLVRLILEHRPDVVVDCVNTATGISYQDVYTASAGAKLRVEALNAAVAADGGAG